MGSKKENQRLREDLVSEGMSWKSGLEFLEHYKDDVSGLSPRLIEAAIRAALSRVADLEGENKKLRAIAGLFERPQPHDKKCDCKLCKAHPFLSSLSDKGTPEEKAALEWTMMKGADDSDRACMAQGRIDERDAQVALLGEALNIMMDTFRCSPRNVDHEREADAYAKATAALAAPEVVAVREIRWCPTCNDIPHGLMVGTEECSICGDTVLKHSAVILKREGAAERNDKDGG